MPSLPSPKRAISGKKLPLPNLGALSPSKTGPSPRLLEAKYGSSSDKPANRTQSDLLRIAQSTRAGFTRPRTWVLIFGWSLAMCAGLVNVVAFRSWDLYVSHMTGDTTAIGMRIEGVHQRDTDFYDLRHAVLLLVSFIIGAFLCGILIDKNQVHFGGKSFYGFALVGNSVMLIFSAFMPDHDAAACVAACACGLQNAMCTSHFGAVVRTTHVTGTVTDIGSTLGRIAMIFLRKGCRRSTMNVVDRAEVGVDARKLLVLLPMWCSYLLGTIIGAYLHTQIGVYGLLVPASVTGIVGLIYVFFRQRLKGYLQYLEKERLSLDVQTMRGTLERAQTYLRDLNQGRKSRNTTDDCDGEDHYRQQGGHAVIELEEGFEDMLERMRDLEENIGSIYQSPRSCRSAGVSQKDIHTNPYVNSIMPASTSAPASASDGNPEKPEEL